RRWSPSRVPAGSAARTASPNTRRKQSALLIPAFASGTPVVVADVLEEPDLVPLGLGDDFKLLRPGLREDLGVVDREVVRQRGLALPANALDRVKRVAVHPEFLLVRVVVVVELPALEVGRVDDERVAFPAADGVAVVHRVHAGAMRLERDDPG